MSASILLIVLIIANGVFAVSEIEMRVVPLNGR
jgi:hypothetical protein